MQHPTGRRALALVAALALGTAGSAFAQDTSEVGGARFDTTEAAAGAIDTASTDTSAQADTSARMDRDTSAASDTTGASGVQNPPGYRGMERDTTMFPPKRTGEDSAAIDTAEGDGHAPEHPAAADSAP